METLDQVQTRPRVTQFEVWKDTEKPELHRCLVQRASQETRKRLKVGQKTDPWKKNQEALHKGRRALRGWAFLSRVVESLPNLQKNPLGPSHDLQ